MLLQVAIDQLTDVSYSQKDGFVIILVVLGINLLLLIAQLVIDLIKSGNENRYYRIRRITDKAIQVEAEIYKRFIKLSEFTKGEEHEMLDFMIDTQRYVNENRINIHKKVYDTCVSFSDYFQLIISNFAKKDIQKEEKFFKQFKTRYYGK